MNQTRTTAAQRLCWPSGELRHAGAVGGLCIRFLAFAPHEAPCNSPNLQPLKPLCYVEIENPPSPFLWNRDNEAHVGVSFGRKCSLSNNMSPVWIYLNKSFTVVSGS